MVRLYLLGHTVFSGYNLFDELMITNENWWVVTDLDGTLMDHKYDLMPALDTIYALGKLGIPVIPCTSKTYSEVKLFRNKYNLNDPFIIENGGAAYGNHEDSLDEWVLRFGSSYDELIIILNKISSNIGYQLRSIKDLSDAEFTALTGLVGEAISHAMERLWSVPFLTPPSEYSSALSKFAKKYDVSIYQGNRMSHLVRRGTNKGNALNQLKYHLKKPELKIFALGDSPNDLPLLDVADYAVVVPGANGPHPIFRDGIQTGKYIQAPSPHAKGWDKIVRSFFL